MKAKSLSTYSPSYTLEAFAHAIETDDFAEYEKEFASRILTAIRRNKGSGEVLIVQQIRDLLKELGNVPDIDGLGFSMRTRTLFIHQFRSMVEFDYLGVRTRKELGDLAFIFSIVYR